MEKPFDVVPLFPITTYVGALTNNERLTDSLLMHQLVLAFGCPNFLGLRIPVISNLNIPSQLNQVIYSFLKKSMAISFFPFCLM